MIIAFKAVTTKTNIISDNKSILSPCYWFSRYSIIRWILYEERLLFFHTAKIQMVDHLLWYSVFSSIKHRVRDPSYVKARGHELISGEHVPALDMKCRVQESEWKFFPWCLEVQLSPFYVVLVGNGLMGFKSWLGPNQILINHWLWPYRQAV